MEMISPLLESILNCCNQAISLIEDLGAGRTRSMSAMAMLRQLKSRTGDAYSCGYEPPCIGCPDYSLHCVHIRPNQTQLAVTTRGLHHCSFLFCRRSKCYKAATVSRRSRGSQDRVFRIWLFGNMPIVRATHLKEQSKLGWPFVR